MDLIKEIYDEENAIVENTKKILEFIEQIHYDETNKTFSIRENIEPDETLKQKAQSGYSNKDKGDNDLEADREKRVKQAMKHQDKQMKAGKGVAFVKTKDGIKQVKVNVKTGEVLSDEYQGKKLNLKDNYQEVTKENVSKIEDNRMRNTMTRVMKQKEQKEKNIPVMISKEFFKTD